MGKRTFAWVFGLAAVAAGCAGGGSGSPDAGTDTFDRRGMFQSLGSNVLLPTYREFQEQTAALGQATVALESAVGTSTEAEALQTAQQAWRDAMAVWQRAELMRVGPAGQMGVVTGGETLRDEIYSWPTSNSCRIDQELVAGNFSNPGFFEGALVNVFGLDALEYLLFYTGTENTCPPQATINASGQWAALGEAEIHARRLAYANAAAGYLNEVAGKLVNAWEPTGGNFLQALSTAGSSGSVYETERMAADELFAAMFYLDLITKDAKLAVPAGISAACAADTCPEAVESRWANASKEAILGNLEGFRLVFTGGEGLGFDDWLVARGAAELAADVIARTDAAIAAVEAVPGTLEGALGSEPDSVRAVHAAVKGVTDLLKSQMVTVLNLSVPDEGAGDND